MEEIWFSLICFQTHKIMFSTYTQLSLILEDIEFFWRFISSLWRYFHLCGDLEVWCNLFSLIFLDLLSSHKLILYTHNFVSFFKHIEFFSLFHFPRFKMKHIEIIFHVSLPPLWGMLVYIFCTMPYGTRQACKLLHPKSFHLWAFLPNPDIYEF